MPTKDDDFTYTDANEFTLTTEKRGEMTKLMLPEIHVGRARPVGSLTVFPLWTAAPSPIELVTARLAQIKVSELDPPEINWLIISNPGDSPLLLLEGELLVGGWQHRVVAGDVVVAPRSNLRVPVMCVEAGRWHGGGHHVRSNERVAPSIRAVTGIERPSAQSEVWGRVSHLEGLYGASATSSYVDVEAAAVNLPTVCYEPLPGQQGVLVGAAGYPALVELFPSTDDLQSSIEVLLRSVMLEAVGLPGAGEPVPDRRARRLIGRLEAISLSETAEREAGLATTVAACTEKVMVRATRYGGSFAHVVAFDRRHQLIRA